MNLSPLGVAAFETQGFEAIYRSGVGDPGAPDQEMSEWARTEHCTVFAHDLDFSRLLALTQTTDPSVLQLRSQSVLPARVGPLVFAALRQHGDLSE